MGKERKKAAEPTRKTSKSNPQRITMPPCPTIDGLAMRRLREGLGLTMKAAAVAAGMRHRQVWFRLESGQRGSVSLRTLASISIVLKCTVDELLMFDRSTAGNGKKKKAST